MLIGGSMNNSNIDYDISDEQSIIEYASKLVGHSLREVTDVDSLADHKKRRGALAMQLKNFILSIQSTVIQILISLKWDLN